MGIFTEYHFWKGTRKSRTLTCVKYQQNKTNPDDDGLFLKLSWKFI